ncbi:hypothetical protein [Kiritimatiella glycovorans]|uniref:Iron-only hydrogenase system regulator n=1 Tax=Kiritimatiella glycovorans TaxID=1307763 RepID=A0A0G3EJP2_9BACT|nr:hypothetical protein [Kiritimatiella glycovorans]AKJ64344.1 hypothetical protein L21SP4_01092 [Kiritimatiella glycovorans]
MKEERHVIMGIHISDRVSHAVSVQEVLTRYGHKIKTRLGLHEFGGAVTVPNGVLILDMVDDEESVVQFMNELNGLEGVEVQRMVFDHP